MKQFTRVPFLFALLVSAGATLGAVHPAHATPQLRIRSPFQVLVVDGVEFGFEADVTVCRDQSNRGFGFVEFSTANDAVRLVPVSGGIDWRTRGVVLTFVPVIDREIGPDDLVVAVVQPASSDPDCLIWDLAGTSVQSGFLPPPFDAEGRISLSRRGRRCEPVDYGQLDAWVLIDTPLQPVAPLPPSDIIGFEARIGLNRDQAARGYLDVHLPGGTVSYDPIFGAVLPGGDAISGRAVVVFLLADHREAPLNTNDHLLRATVAVDRVNPDCLIWDLTNGESGAVDGMFDALGDITVWPPRGRRDGALGEQLNNKYPENFRWRR